MEFVPPPARMHTLSLRTVNQLLIETGKTAVQNALYYQKIHALNDDIEDRIKYVLHF